jgi:hypothetical protein
MTWLTVMKYLWHTLLRICSICRNHNPVLSIFMTYPRVYIRVTPRMPLIMEKLLNLPQYMSSPPKHPQHMSSPPNLSQHMSSPPIFSEVRFAKYFVFCDDINLITRTPSFNNFLVSSSYTFS